MPSRLKASDAIGKRYGRLIINDIESIKDKNGKWFSQAVCSCDCGSQVKSRFSSISRGSTQSCGCLQKERAIACKTTHGSTNTPEWRIWTSLKGRCQNPKNKDYDRYGGRGITIHDSWNSFKTFISDMGLKPTSKSTIERIRNNEGYGPENCIWASMLEQANNRRSNLLLKVNGEVKTCAQWARIVGVLPGLISNRIKDGWNHERSVLTPPRNKRPNGQAKT